MQMKFSRSRFRSRLAIVATAGLAATAGLLTTWSAQAASAGCAVTYSVTNQGLPA
jgi:hypothetical protein